MEWLWQSAVSNALAASVLAVPAALAGVFCRRPALVHGLWLIVLLKLITPPVYPLEMGALIDFCATQAESPTQPLVVETPVPASASEQSSAGLSAAALTTVGGTAAALDDSGESASEQFPSEPESEIESARMPASTESTVVEAWTAPSWQAIIPACWLVGSVLWFLVSGARIARFQWLLRSARLAPGSLQEEAERLARQLGLPNGPEVRLLTGRVSPMLWVWAGRRFLLLPAGLLKRLTAAQRATLLTHELAHLRRSDHWVRGLEFLVTGLYWWHPVVWWARREIREAEEQCCDAWVVWALPAAAKAYALALVETIDFLSETRPVLPPVASGIGHVHTLKRRLTMIMQGTTPRALTWGGLVAVLGLATTLLPLAPSWAQTDPRRDNIEEQKRRAEEAVKQAEAARQAAEAQRQKAMEDLRTILAQEREHAQRAQAEARTRAREIEARGDDFQRARDEVMELGRSLKAMRADLEKMQQQVQATEQRFRQSLERLGAVRARGERDQRGNIIGRDGDTSAGPQEPGFRRGSDPAGFGGRMSGPGSGGGRGGPMTGGMGGTGTMGRPGPDQERRLQDLEKKVDLLLQEISNLRRDLRGGQPGWQRGGGGPGGRPGAGAPPGGGPGGGAGRTPGELPGSGTGTGGSSGAAGGTGSAAPGAGAAAGSTSSATSKPAGSR